MLGIVNPLPKLEREILCGFSILGRRKCMTNAFAIQFATFVFGPMWSPLWASQFFSLFSLFATFRSFWLHSTI